MVLSLNSQLAAINGYSNTTSTVNTTLDIAQSSLTELGTLSTTIQQEVTNQPSFNLDSNGQTTAQVAAASQLDEMLSLLNTQVGTNYIFSGSALNQPAVASTSQILNGTGAQAGLTQIINERQQADLGASGMGRLSVSTSGQHGDAESGRYAVRISAHGSEPELDRRDGDRAVRLTADDLDRARLESE